MRTDDLPAGLPPGRLVATSYEYPTWIGEPIYWASPAPGGDYGAAASRRDLTVIV